MEVRAKRSVLTAFLLSLLAPCSGLLYIHKPLRALICLLFLLAAVAAATRVDLLASWKGMLGCLAVGAIAWLYALLSSMWLARRGLTDDEARHDIGPWIVAYLALSLILAWMPDRSAYTGYRMAGEVMEPALKSGDYVLSRRISGGDDAPRQGELVVYLDEQGDGLAYIRRVAAVAGDVLDLRDGVLRRNGADTDIRLDALPDGASALVVPPRTVLLTADSGDGLWHNQLAPEANIRSRLLYIYWSADLSRLGDVERATPRRVTGEG